MSIKRVSKLSNMFTTTESNNYTLFSYQNSELIDETDWIQLGQSSFTEFVSAGLGELFPSMYNKWPTKASKTKYKLNSVYIELS